MSVSGEDSALLRAVLDAAPTPQGIARLGDGLILYANPAMLEMLGRAPEDLLGRTGLEIGIWESPAQREALMADLRRSGRVVDVPLSFETPAGRTRRVRGTFGIVEADGERFLSVTWRDVTEQAALESAFRDQEGLLKAILSAAGEAVIALDRRNVVTLVNQAASTMLGYRSDELIGQNFHDLAHHSYPDGSPYPRDECPLYRTTRDGKSERVAGEVFWRGDGRPVPVEYTTNPMIVNGEIVGATVIARDVTQELAAQAMLEEATAVAEGTSAAKTTFLSHMSHELRTPLNVVLGFAELLAMRDLPNDPADDVQQIQRAGQHLLDLINDALDISRIEAGGLSLSLEPVCLPEIVAEVVSLVGPMASEAGIDLGSNVEGHVDVQADTQRLRQVLLNLLSNAVKYNRPGGTAEVRTLGPDEGRVVIEVADTGRGITPERIPRLFEPFERLEGDTSGIEGTGLGLALTQRLVGAMSGTIAVESVEGEGSVFRVVLTQAVRDHAARADHELQGVGPAEVSGKARVLYVEDNPANIRLVEAALRTRPGVELVAAMQGGIAMELALLDAPDLVLLDLHLPDMSGEEVLRRLRGHPATRDCRILVVSADATKDRIAKLHEAGADDYLTKPIEISRLLREVDAVITPPG